MSNNPATAANAGAARPPHTIRMDEARQRRDRRQRRRPAAGTRASPTAWSLRERVPQGHKVALRRSAEGAPVRRYDVAIGYAPKAIAAGSWVHERLLRDAGGARARGPADRDRRAAPAAAPLEGYTFEGYPQRRRHRSARATSWRSRRPCSASPAWSSIAVDAHQGRAAAALSERRRRRRPRAHLRLRRRDRRARRDDPDPHAAQHQPEPELRRRGDGGEPRLREAAARAAAAAGHASRSRRARRSPTRGRSTSSACRTRRTSASCR